jgi:hypothetical protein
MKEGGEGNGYFCENQNKIRIGDPYYKMILTYEQISVNLFQGSEIFLWNMSWG